MILKLTFEKNQRFRMSVNYFKGLDLSKISSEERERVERYVLLTGVNVPRWEDPENVVLWQMATGYVRASGNDPEKAAAVYFKAQEASEKAFREYFNNANQNLPIGQMAIIAKWWESNPGGTHPIHEEMYKEAERRSAKVFGEMIFESVFRYLDKLHELE